MSNRTASLAARFPGHTVTASGRDRIALGTQVIVTRSTGQSFTAEVVQHGGQAYAYMVRNTYNGQLFMATSAEMELDA